MKIMKELLPKRLRELARISERKLALQRVKDAKRAINVPNKGDK